LANRKVIREGLPEEMAFSNFTVPGHGMTWRPEKRRGVKHSLKIAEDHRKIIGRYGKIMGTYGKIMGKKNRNKGLQLGISSFYVGL